MDLIKKKEFRQMILAELASGNKISVSSSDINKYMGNLMEFEEWCKEHFVINESTKFKKYVLTREGYARELRFAGRSIFMDFERQVVTACYNKLNDDFYPKSLHYMEMMYIDEHNVSFVVGFQVCVIHNFALNEGQKPLKYLQVFYPKEVKRAIQQ